MLVLGASNAQPRSWSQHIDRMAKGRESSDETDTVLS
jgi:hypothetical protein